MRVRISACLLAILAPPLAAAPATAPTQATRPWTILVYGAADNDADGPILEFLDQVRKALDDEPGVELLLWIDRSEGYSDDATLLGEDFSGTRLYRLRRDSAERLSGGEFFPEFDADPAAELDSSDAYNLRRFIDWGKARYPAQRTGLMIYSHANGQTMCPDEGAGDGQGGDMGIPELTRALGERQSLDFLALELCNMGGIEIAYEWRPAPGRFGADVLVAIPNAGPPLDWDRAFARLRSSGHATVAGAGAALDPAAMSAADFGRLVIEEGRRGRELAAERAPERVRHEAAGCYDLRAAESVKRAVDVLAVALAAGDTKDVFGEMRGPGAIGDALGYDPNSGGPLVDLYDLAARTAGCDAFDATVRARAQDVMGAADAFVLASFGMAAYPGFEPGRNGVFIVLPVNEPDRWQRFGWYTPLGHERDDKDLGRWGFLADGATAGNRKVEGWFELLDAWFDAADEAGGVNGYRF